jgi:hypothetical protein
MPLPPTDESESFMICLQYASMLPFNHYINVSKIFPKHVKCVLHFPVVFCLHARLAGCLRCSCINRYLIGVGPLPTSIHSPDRVIGLSPLPTSVHSPDKDIYMFPSLVKLSFPFLPDLFITCLTFDGWGKRWPFILIEDDCRLLIFI